MRNLIFAAAVIVMCSSGALAQNAQTKCPTGTVSLPDAGGQYSCVPLPRPH